MACLFLLPPVLGADSALRLALGELSIAPIVAKNVVLELADQADRGGQVRIGYLSLGERELHDVVLACGVLSLADGVIACRNGRLAGVPGADGAQVTLRYDTAQSSGALRLAFSAGGAIDARLDVSGAIVVTLTRLPIGIFAAWLPQLATWQAGGNVDGTVRYAARRAHADLTLSQGKFSDADGLHAGESLNVDVDVVARRTGEGWVGDVQLRWPEGAVFWNPVLLSPEISLMASGRIDGDHVHMESAHLRAPGIGALTASGVFDLERVRLRKGEARLEGGDLAVLVPQFVLPVLAPAQTERWRTSGMTSAHLQWSSDTLESATVSLDGVGFSYLGQRFRVGPISGEIPWHRDHPTTAQVHVDGLGWQKLAFAAFDVSAWISGDAIEFAPLRLPVLDGALVVASLDFEKENAIWEAGASLYMEPVSMRRFTEALQLPSMAGTLSASIPAVSASSRRIALGGALVIAAFDGYVQATGLEVVDPFGLVPRLTADVSAEHLDLEQLTETFSFGSVSGFIDISVNRLEMAAWRPVMFDAVVRSTPGDYRRRISQRAVENITALGGAGAVAAIQRSFLRFFNDFGYRELGLACRLRGNVCEMQGLDGEGRADAPFLIVRGGGVPALNVIGYNRRVDWVELIERLARVTAGDAKPIIQ